MTLFQVVGTVWFGYITFLGLSNQSSLATVVVEHFPLHLEVVGSNPAQFFGIFYCFHN